jgi:hypothetical protein
MISEGNQDLLSAYLDAVELSAQKFLLNHDSTRR